MASDKPKLLIVDDEKDIGYVLVKGLKSFGFEGVAYDDPAKALEDYQPNSYAGIILDIRMPKMSGFELARAIWEQDPGASICFMTAFDIYEQEAKALFPNLKSTCFITKPVSVARLVAHLAARGIVKEPAKSD